MDWGSGRRVATFLRQKFYSTNNQGLGGGISEGSVGELVLLVVTVASLAFTVGFCYQFG